MGRYEHIKDSIKRTAIGNLLSQLYRRIRLLFYPQGNLNVRYDIETKEILKKTLATDSVCIDVGCHKGEILRLMQKYAPRGVHYCFEPIPELYQQLKKDFSQNAIIYDIALSDRQGSINFNHVLSNPAYSGILKRRYDRKHEIDTTIKVKTDLLDNIIPIEVRIDCIKIDVEGAEYLVLKGAKNTILRSKPIIIFETGLGGTDVYGIKPDDIYSFLFDTCGLVVSTMKRKLTKQQPLDKDSFRDIFNNGTDYYFIAYPPAAE